MLASLSKETKQVFRVLLLALTASTGIAIVKIIYGKRSGSLAFVADGLHSLFDSGSTLLGMFSVILADQPPDEGHPYGHRKFETLSSLFLAMLLLLAGWEVFMATLQRLAEEKSVPTYSPWGFGILFLTMGINLGVAAYEGRAATKFRSSFLASDAIHNRSDFVITIGVLASVLAAQWNIRYVDAIVSGAIAAYLVYLAVHIVRLNIQPLVDHSVLDPEEVRKIVCAIDGVMDCHNIRSRGEKWHHFLDLNIHLSGRMSLEKAHELTHKVEAKLKDRFPGLIDVVIHTEPHDHPPCSKG
jgi:cation diffusion facilitator family transporter